LWETKIVKSSLNALETRVIACLIEKEFTTPDQYPLSLNSLMSACNQKTNRDPILSLNELTVQAVIDALIKRHLIMEKTGFGSRVPKYQHRFCNTDFNATRFTPQETAILCELMLRGPQTVGELRIRAERMVKFSDVQEVERCLTGLATREDGAVVVKLAREPGKREARYAQLFSEEQPYPVHAGADAPAEGVEESGADRILNLERQVSELRRDLDELRARLGE
jgi:uncharacterized protein